MTGNDPLGAADVRAGGAASAWLRQLQADVQQARGSIRRSGLIKEAFGTLIRAVGVQANIGDLCELRAPDGRVMARAEVVGIQGQQLVLMPYSALQGLSSAIEVVPVGSVHSVAVSTALQGRVVDAFGTPLDALGAIDASDQVPLYARAPTPMRRQLIRRMMPSGVKVVDALVALGEGQRIGVFAPAGAGKSSLLGMVARGAESDITVIALIGERGREVREFIEYTLGPQGLARACLVVATSDAPAAERLRAAYAATAMAEYFRDRGLRVMLVVDSLTRFARAQREIGLASGEPPTRHGYPPSTFAVLPQLLERAGPAEKGSITAIYTVLTDDEEASDPIAEEVRSILDGHVVLSRKLVEKGQFPAVDPLASLSRLMMTVASAEHIAAAQHLRRLMAKYREVELLVQLGEYRSGGDALADEAIAKNAAINRFLAQPLRESADMAATLRALLELAGTSKATT